MTQTESVSQDTQGTVWVGSPPLPDIWGLMGEDSNGRGTWQGWAEGWSRLQAYSHTCLAPGLGWIKGGEGGSAGRGHMVLWPPAQKSQCHFCCTTLVKAVTPNSIQVQFTQFHPNSKGRDRSLRELAAIFWIDHTLFCRGRKIQPKWLRCLPKVIELAGEG